QLFPVCLDGLVSPAFGEGLGFAAVACADGLEHRLVIEVEEVVDLAKGVGMSTAHEAVADESYVNRFHVEMRVSGAFSFCARVCVLWPEISFSWPPGVSLVWAWFVWRPFWRRVFSLVSSWFGFRFLSWICVPARR